MATNQKEERPFEFEDIEDVKVILVVKGKHYSIIAENNKEEAKATRIAFAIIVIAEGKHKIVIPSLEEIKEKRHGKGKV
jgi:hypothetical protein